MWNRIWEFLCDNDWLLLFIPMLIMTILFCCAGLFYWGVMFTIIMAVFGLTELWAKLTTKETISNQFRTFLKEHKIFAWIIIWVMATFWFALIVHLVSN